MQAFVGAHHPVALARLASAALLLGVSACNGPAGHQGIDGPSSATAQSAPSSSAEAGPSGGVPRPEPSTAPGAASASSAATGQDGSRGGDASRPAQAETSGPSGSAEASASPTAASTGGSSAETAQGPAQGTDAFSTWLQSSGKYQAGVPGTVQAVLVAKPGYHCNDKYPYKFKLDPAPAGLSYPDSTAKGINFGPSRSTLSIPFVPEKPGSYAISGTFSLCNETTCKIQKQPLSVQITVGPGK